MKLDAMPMVSFYSLFCSPVQLYNWNAQDTEQ